MSVAVIGAGITGLSIAFHLCDADIGEVTLFDGAGIGRGASAIQPGGVRQQWSTQAACAIARESHAVYARLADHLGVQVGARLEPCGYAFVADTEATLLQLRSNVAVQNECGVPSVILSPEDLADVVPGLAAAQVAGAAYCAEDGYFDDPQAVVAAFAEAATRRGARFEAVHVDAIHRDRRGWLVASRRWDQVVVAAGAESATLLGPLGFELPIVRESRHLFFGAPVEGRRLDPLVVALDRGIAAKQVADGRLLTSDLRAHGEPASWRARIVRELGSLLPALEVSTETLVSGEYDATPDAQPIVDRLDDGLWVAAGLSGHGFMIAPSVGALVVAGLTGGPLPAWHEAVSYTRFGSGDRDAEAQVI